MLIGAYYTLNLVYLVFCLTLGYVTIKNQPNTNVAQIGRRFRKLALVLLAWQAYVFALDATGIIHGLSFPPRFALLGIIPAFIGIAIFLLRHRRKNWLSTININHLTAFQSIRIGIELLFVQSVAAGILHPNVTFEGYNMDLLFGLTAPIVYLIGMKKGRAAHQFIRMWNVLGILVIFSIMFLFTTNIYMPELYPNNTIPFPVEATYYPYVLVACVHMPTALGLHFLSLLVLSKQKNEHN